MTSLYKRIDDKLHYWEILQDDDRYILHWGMLGAKGEIKVIDSMFGDPQQMIMLLIDDRAADGFDSLPFETILVVQYNKDSNYDNLTERAEEIELWLSDLMKWTALGTTAGFSVMDENVEVYCYVVDYAVALERVSAELAESSFGMAAAFFRKEIPEVDAGIDQLEVD